jgi:CHAT domain-containing protein/Tfp pilus assembly protein PilF
MSGPFARTHVGVSLGIAAVAVLVAIPKAVQAQTAASASLEQLNSQVLELYSAGRYREAIPLAKQVLAILETALDPQHPNVAIGLDTLAQLYGAAGAHAQAEPLFKRALAIREDALGPQHPDTARSLNNLAAHYHDAGAYSQAEVLLKRVLAIREKTLSPEHPDTARSLNNLAEHYRVVGDFARAEALFKRAVAILEKAVGPQHPETATSLNNLAAVYYNAGRFAQAEQLYKRALAISEKTLPEHPDTARRLNNLAELYRATGAYAQAEPLCKRALSIFEKTFGPEHPDTARSLNNLAALYHDTGDDARAEPLYVRALAAWEKTLPPEHPQIATGLNNLAELYRATGDLAKAELFFKRSLSIWVRSLGPEHTDTARSLNNLAELYRMNGDYARAEPLYKRAQAIWEKALGPHHPETGLGLSNLGVLYWAQGRWSEAAVSMQRGLRIEEENARRVLSVGDESRKRAYAAAILAGSAEAAVAFSLDYHRKASGTVRLGLEVVLQRKGRVQDLMADSFAAARTSMSPSDRRLFDQWRQSSARVAALTFRGRDNTTEANYRELLESSRRRAESLEAQLSQRSAEFQTRVETVTIERIQRALPADAVLIEWFRYHPLDPTAKKTAPLWNEPRYIAYVLRREGEPVAVDVGEAAPIETKVSDLLAALGDRATTVSTLARELDRQLMQPLRRYLGGAEQILISPAGVLHLLPFSVLRDEQGRYLVQHKELTYLTTGRDLIRASVTTPSRQPPLVVADPDFGPVAGSTIASSSDNRRSADISRGSMNFSPLPGTAAEAQALKAVLHLRDEQVLTRRTATEAALKQVKSPRILHLATHGFFLPDREVSRRARGRVNLELGEQWYRGVSSGENPLLRSGLALAGANQLRSGSDDGILTALEVTGLDLAGTELVVLSACETGLGAVNYGEGVYGLRRALVLAGARTQVASLWKVNDASAKELMIDFYTRLSAGAGRSQALREAQLAMLTDPSRAHPYHWAAFMVIGDGAPLTR